MSKNRKKQQPIPVAGKTKMKKTQQLPLGLDEGKKKLLHVGCGSKRDNALPKFFRDGEWQEIRLDIDPSVQPDIVADIMEMKEVADGSMDAVYSSHNLEHVFAFQVPQVLSEFYRVVKTGGSVYITCPDLQAVAFHVALGKLDSPLYPSPAGQISAQDVLYGHGESLQKKRYYMAHKGGFTAESLGRKLQAAGFRAVLVERDNDFNLWARGVKFSREDPRSKEEKITLRGRYPFQVVRSPDVVSGKMPDELDLPPKIWKPLGLKRA